MGLRLLLRTDHHRAERDLSANLVQEAGLDLIRPAAFPALVLLLLAASAQAQPLIPNPGLTSLLRPQQLDHSRPLISEDRSAGTRSGLRPAAPPGAGVCDRPRPAASARAATAPAGPTLYGGGSGPGDYGHYIPGGPPTDPAGKKPGASPPTAAGSAPKAERPLYAGNDRPLWASGAPRAAPASGQPPAPGQDPSGTGQPNTVPTPVRDRPLWAMRDATANDPATDPAAIGADAGPCTTSSAPLLPQ